MLFYNFLFTCRLLLFNIRCIFARFLKNNLQDIHYWYWSFLQYHLNHFLCSFTRIILIISCEHIVVNIILYGFYDFHTGNVSFANIDFILLVLFIFFRQIPNQMIYMFVFTLIFLWSQNWCAISTYQLNYLQYNHIQFACIALSQVSMVMYNA